MKRWTVSVELIHLKVDSCLGLGYGYVEHMNEDVDIGRQRLTRRVLTHRTRCCDPPFIPRSCVVWMMHATALTSFVIKQDIVLRSAGVSHVSLII